MGTIQSSVCSCFIFCTANWLSLLLKYLHRLISRQGTHMYLSVFGHQRVSWWSTLIEVALDQFSTKNCLCLPNSSRVFNLSQRILNFPHRVSLPSVLPERRKSVCPSSINCSFNSDFVKTFYCRRFISPYPHRIPCNLPQYTYTCQNPSAGYTGYTTNSGTC